MPYPDARSHHKTTPETQLDPQRNALPDYIGNAHTDRHCEHHVGGFPQAPYQGLEYIITEESAGGKDFLATEELVAAYALQET